MTRWFFKKNKTVQEALGNLQRLVVREIRKKYPETECFAEDDLIQTIEEVYSENNRQVVIVIDEWDAVLGSG